MCTGFVRLLKSAKKHGTSEIYTLKFDNLYMNIFRTCNKHFGNFILCVGGPSVGT